MHSIILAAAEGEAQGVFLVCTAQASARLYLTYLWPRHSASKPMRQADDQLLGVDLCHTPPHLGAHTQALHGNVYRLDDFTVVLMSLLVCATFLVGSGLAFARKMSWEKL